ncbi:MAG: hypothetical protein ABSF84_13520 [Acidimicrobiales bacterium]
MIEAPVAVETDEVDGADEDPAPSEKVTTRTPEQQSRRRFTIAVLVGSLVVSVPYLWVLWDLWSGQIDALRKVPPDNFYELQARAMFAGHLYVPSGSLGIEGFLHDGRTYTYFGLWPSIIRMPVLVFTHHFDGALTAPSLLAAWLLTGLFGALLIWRIRILIRGTAIVGRAEAASYGALMATILGGSVLMFLAANASTYDEDFAWSVALVIGSLFALLGMMERPTTKGAIASGLLILAANLNRSPTGYACVIAAFLVAGWFALGKGGKDQRRWAWWTGLGGLIALLADCAVTYAKFGIPFGLPMADQVWAQINAHRRYFLAANGGKAFSVRFIPSTVWAYMDPGAIRFSSLFPFIAAPPTPAHAVGGVVLDQTYATPSFTAVSPLLFLLGCWGLVTAFRPRGIGNVRLTRLIMVGAAAATAGVLVWGYIAYRYVSDLMPFLIIASAIGLIDIWRRLDGKSPRVRGWVLGGVTALALFSVVANVAISATPSTWFAQGQVANFVTEQQTDTPTALAATVVKGNVLPYYAPAGTLFIAGHCDALYRSTGDSFATSPGQQIEHATWAPVEQSGSMISTIDFTFNRTGWSGPDVPLLTYDKATLLLQPAAGGMAIIRVVDAGAPSITWPSSVGYAFPQILHGVYTITVTTDPYLHSIVVGWYGSTMIDRYLAGDGPAQIAVTPISTNGPQPAITVSAPPTAPPTLGLCHALLHH